MRPLEGITIVALEHAIAAPFCTRQLADLGARVIKIERTGIGDLARGYDVRVKGQSSYFIWVNRSKESLTLDVKQPQAAEIIQRLLSRADVLVQNLAPGATERMGLSYQHLKAKHPRLIVCDISGYGDDGPYRDKKAYDLLIQAEAGVLSVTGSKDAPAKAGLSIADIASAMYAYSGILAALIQRGRTGQGSRIDVSMLESTLEWMGFPLYYAYDGAAPPPRNGAAHATIYPYGAFKAGDGKTVMLGVQSEREWLRFCEIVLRMPALASDARFSSNVLRNAKQAELAPIVEQVFAALDSAELLRRLDQAAIANAQMNDMHDVWKHAQLAARGRWTEIETPQGRVPALYPPGQSADTQPRMDAVPALGQHTDAILAELGYGADAIARLKAATVV